MKNVAGVATIGVLSALAVTGWTQRISPNTSAAPAAYNQPVAQPAFYAQPAVQLAATPYVSMGAPTDTQPRYQTVADRRYEGDRYRQPGYSYGQSSRYNNRARPGRYDNGYYNNGGYYNGGYYGERPASHSAIIVGGGAAAGAAIGGMAGGGKGAAIGALAGGGAGLIYDRMTHNNARW
jgi:hypothetical protein